MRVSNKVRISLSLDKELVDWLDRERKQRRFATRSHAVEYCVQQVINSEEKRYNKRV